MNPLWKIYKSKVLKTFNPDYEEDMAEQVENLKKNNNFVRLRLLMGLKFKMLFSSSSEDQTSTQP